MCVTVGLNGNGFCYRKLCVLSFKPSHCFSKSPKARRDFLQAFGDNKLSSFIFLIFLSTHICVTFREQLCNLYIGKKQDSI